MKNNSFCREWNVHAGFRPFFKALHVALWKNFSSDVPRKPDALGVVKDFFIQIKQRPQ